MLTPQPIRSAACTLFCLTWLLTAPARSDELVELTNKATMGDAAAQSELGRRYSSGEGVARDDAQAVAWFRKAAAQGHAGAEVSLGTMYKFGVGVRADRAESIRWYRLAAAKGNTSAQYLLGLDYAQGRGVERDPAQAARWFRKAAVQGHARAQFDLGELYEAGRGVPQSNLEAFVLYTLAGEQENEVHIPGNAQADVSAKRSLTKQALTPAEREAAQSRIDTARALAAVQPRKFGAPGLIGKSRGWWVWKSWNPETWEAEVTSVPPGETLKVQVLPWATTYRHQAYGARFDELLPGEKMNMFFDASPAHRRGFVVHFQDEISQMKGHGHAWQVREVTSADKFVAQVFAGDKPLEEKSYSFEIDPACKKWLNGKQVDIFPLKPGDRLYMTWVYRDDRRVAMLLTDDASLETLKQLETKRISEQIAQDGLAGQLETVDQDQVQFMVYSTYWAQANQLKPGDTVQLATTGTGYRPLPPDKFARVSAKVVSQKNRGVYGSGVNDVVLKLENSADAERFWSNMKEKCCA